MLEFDQNVLLKYHLKETSHDFKTIIRQRIKHNSLNICDASTIYEIISRQNTNAHSLDSCIVFTPLSAFCKLLVIVEDRGNYVVGTTTLHKLNLPLAYQLPDLIHEIFTVFN
jgi:hypothetical protein